MPVHFGETARYKDSCCWRETYPGKFQFRHVSKIQRASELNKLLATATLLRLLLWLLWPRIHYLWGISTILKKLYSKKNIEETYADS